MNAIVTYSEASFCCKSNYRPPDYDISNRKNGDANKTQSISRIAVHTEHGVSKWALSCDY